MSPVTGRSDESPSTKTGANKPWSMGSFLGNARDIATSVAGAAVRASPPYNSPPKSLIPLKATLPFAVNSFVLMAMLLLALVASSLNFL